MFHQFNTFMKFLSIACNLHTYNYCFWQIRTKYTYKLSFPYRSKRLVFDDFTSGIMQEIFVNTIFFTK